jgi:hypothetical protein
LAADERQSGLLSHHTLVAILPSAINVPDRLIHFFFFTNHVIPQGFYLSGTKNGIYSSVDSLSLSLSLINPSLSQNIKLDIIHSTTMLVSSFLKHPPSGPDAL